MVIVLIFLALGKAARHAGRKHDDKLLALIIIKNFGCPGVFCSRFVTHHIHMLLGRPMHQIGRTGVADAFVVLPTGRPNQTKYAVLSLGDRWVAHNFGVASLGL